MSYERGGRDRGYGGRRNDNPRRDTDRRRDGHHRKEQRDRDEVYSKRVPAGKRTYFFDVKTTRSGRDFFLTITESKRLDDDRYEKHKIFLYKEDFGKFVRALHEVISHVREECLPDYEFRGLPDLPDEGYVDDIGDEEDYDDYEEEESAYLGDDDDY